MSKADRLTVSKAMSTRSRQLEKELTKYARVNPDEWRKRVIEAAHKVLGQQAERPSIRCIACGLTSYNKNDISHKFCGRCHKFHEAPTDYELNPKEEDAMRHPTHTYTLAMLEISPSAYEEIRALLERADYHHVIDAENGHIDMTGIALIPMRPPIERAEDETVTVLTAALTPETIERMEAFVEQHSTTDPLIVVDMEDGKPPADVEP